MNHVFISYSHADADFVHLLEEGLRLCGYKVWRDIRNIRAGSTLSKEVAPAIDDSAVFISCITPNYEKSTWLDNELSRAISKGIPVVPLVFNGTEAPIQVEGLVQVRVDPMDGGASALEIFGMLDKIRPAITAATEEEEENCDSSGEEDWSDSDELEELLIGTRWSWCENSEYQAGDKWIKFLAGGKLQRSWRPNKTRWSVSANGYVLYTPHVLSFNLEEGSFQGAISDPSRENPQRSGKKL